MCGIAGFVTQAGEGGEALLAANVQRMTDAIAHRGPDSYGAWTDPRHGVALGHRRLSIIDLSPAGAQPMPSASGRWVVAYNGEIYNYQSLRRELEAAGRAPQWRGTSDTEVMLAAFEAYGIAGALERITGMFALAAWDRETATLYLARDRLGEKPLYYGFVPGSFVFGSELKALRAHPRWQGRIDRNAIASFLRHSYVPAPMSIYEGICKLPPGAYVALTHSALRGGQLPEVKSYWSLEAYAAGAGATRDAGYRQTHADEVEATLKQVLQEQMVADVPLGAFLSGGIDSSTVVALMQSLSPRAVKTFTIGFQQDDFNEAPYAKAVAAHLGTEHHELYVSPQDTLDVVPLLARMYDEPFADSSQIPTHLVSKLARSHVTVALSGDGGDEFFGGYSRYAAAQKLRWLHRVPRPLRALTAACIGGAAARPAGAALSFMGPALPAALRVSHPATKLDKLAKILRMQDMQAVYTSMVSHWTAPDEIVIGGTETPGAKLAARAPMLSSLDFIDWMMYADALTYLPDDIMVKVDRASMAVSLETRAPFLDRRVVELGWRLPRDAKLQNGVGKRVLRDILAKYVPPSLTERPKMGFGVPVAQWLRGPLRDWAEALLSEERLGREGWLSPQPIRERWASHLQGRDEHQYLLWDVLMFQSWLESASD